MSQSNKRSTVLRVRPRSIMHVDKRWYLKPSRDLSNQEENLFVPIEFFRFQDKKRRLSKSVHLPALQRFYEATLQSSQPGYQEITP